jgi:hypothetical protein
MTSLEVSLACGKLVRFQNGTVLIRHQCRKTAVLSCHRFLINSGVEKMNKVIL